jgi:hypothetical protein
LYMERTTFDSQQTEWPTNGRADNVHAPVADDGGERGRNWAGHTRETSLYTRAFLHPRAAALIAASAMIALAAIGRGSKSVSSTKAEAASARRA